jgi:pimeloyl-ACP methyl ester carboxylesterase
VSYIDVAGHPTWVVDDGDGAPMLLLHGAFHGSDALLPVLGALGDGRRLVAFDRRGHGRTADTTEPFSYESMADEAIAVLEARDAGPADVVGYSDGAITALYLALRRPDLVRSLVLMSANIKPLPSETFALDPDSPATAMLRAIHGALSPDGADHFDEVVRKTEEMFGAQPTFSLDELASIDVPALVMAADRDDIELEETAILHRTLPSAQLAIVPNATHAFPWERADVVLTLITQFLVSVR